MYSRQSQVVDTLYLATLGKSPFEFPAPLRGRADLTSLLMPSRHAERFWSEVERAGVDATPSMGIEEAARRFIRRVAIASMVRDSAGVFRQACAAAVAAPSMDRRDVHRIFDTLSKHLEANRLSPGDSFHGDDMLGRDGWSDRHSAQVQGRTFVRKQLKRSRHLVCMEPGRTPEEVERDTSEAIQILHDLEDQQLPPEFWDSHAPAIDAFVRADHEASVIVAQVIADLSEGEFEFSGEPTKEVLAQARSWVSGYGPAFRANDTRGL